VTTSISITLSTVLPPITECVPQELLPIMPPRVHRSWVAGSTENVSPCFLAAPRSWSQITPGWTRAVRAPASRLTIWFMYLEKSNTTAAFTLWPASPVPQPRASTGTSCSRHTSSAASTSPASRGMTTPTGICR
jgi:hypothetical protein